jgi:regulator of nucleoside diphosphate kinase
MNHPPSLQADSAPDIKITRGNLRRLDSLLASHAGEWSWRAVEYLARELMRSTVVDDREIPANTVTMRSRVEFRAEGIGVRQVATLVYPGESGLYDDAISILTPVGAALIGLAEGQSISYAMRGGKPATISVTQMLYQPEASRRVRLL